MNIRVRFVALSCLLLLGSADLQAQDLSFSPYSRYAIGDIFHPTTTRNAAMGGIGVASDNYFSINRLNPASYADIVFTTMDVSAFGQYDRISTRTQTATPFHAGLHDAAFAFPSNKGPVITFGFAPYSSVGYSLISRRDIQLDTTYVEENRYLGEGGLNQAFLGAAFRMWKNRLRLGINVQYIFGNTQYRWDNGIFRIVGDTTVLSPDHQAVSVLRDVYVRGANGQTGFIYQDTIKASKRILWRIGGMVEYSIGVSGDRYTTFNNGLVGDTLGSQESGTIALPLKYGGGFMINRPGYWSFGADITYQDWATFTYFSDSLTLGPELRVAVGGEWTPEPDAFKYFKRINYRFGAYYKQSYIQFGDQPVVDYGITMGIGLPAGAQGNSRLNPGRATSRISLSLELGRRGNLKQELPLEELYARIRLGFAINDRWFVRRVVD
ncbi:MAG: hypothetical protein D6722_00530 [Bacteroidetes bacterium]|nr:MAG: hypothetical protein D6722_00530 [Bacteroidota bacterium]